MMNVIGEQAKALNEKLVTWRRHIHANPEIGLDTPKTEAFIVEELKKMGITDIRQGIAKHGLVAHIKGDKPGKVLGIRADIDALAMQEDTGLPFAAKNGWMHACGHDAHASMLLGAAELLNKNKSQLQGTVKLIFQPGEENNEGAIAMIQEGALENPHVDALIGLHTGGLWKGAVTGEIGYRMGAMMAATDWFTITVHGKGGHGATPHLTVDPIAISCQIYTALQTLVSREISPLDSAVVTIGMIQGGTVRNVIAPTCKMGGTFRSLKPESRELLRSRIKELAENVAIAMRGSAVVEYDGGPAPVINDPYLTGKLREAAAEIVGPGHVHEVYEPSMGGEDMATLMEHAPGTFFFHPSFYGDERGYPHHHPKFDIDESVFWIGTATFVQFALTWQQ